MRNPQRMGRPATGELFVGWVPALMVWSRGVSISVVVGRPIRCSFRSLFQLSLRSMCLPIALPAQAKDLLAEARVLLSWL